MLAVNRSTL